jgi:hypothetical protein
VVFVEAPRDADDLIGRADTVMYQVKETGRNDIRIEHFPYETDARRAPDSTAE